MGSPNMKNSIVVANRINDLHDEIMNMGRKTLAMIIEMGRLLSQQKATVGHGKWEKWMKDNLHFSQMTANRYMRVHGDRKTIKSNMMLDLPNGQQPSLTEIYDSVSDGQSKGGIYNVNRNDYFKNSKNSAIYTPRKLAEILHSLLKHLKPRTIVDPSVGKGSLVKPWKQPVIIGIDIDEGGSKYCDAFIHGRFEDIDEWMFENKPDLVLCNPPFNNAPHRELYPEVFLRKIFDLFGDEIPTVLFVPMGFRLNIRNTSQRWQWLSNMDNISSIISLPIDCFGIKYHTEILLFNITGVKPHYFCG